MVFSLNHVKSPFLGWLTMDSRQHSLVSWWNWFIFLAPFHITTLTFHEHFVKSGSIITPRNHTQALPRLWGNITIIRWWKEPPQSWVHSLQSYPLETQTFCGTRFIWNYWIDLKKCGNPRKCFFLVIGFAKKHETFGSLRPTKGVCLPIQSRCPPNQSKPRETYVYLCAFSSISGNFFFRDNVVHDSAVLTPI